MKCPTELDLLLDLLPLLSPDLLSSGLPLLSLDLPLLSLGGGGRRRVVSWGWEAKGRWWRREGGAKERGKPNRRRAEVSSWINGDVGLGEAAVRERVREREERVRELKSKIDYEGKRE